MFSKIHLCLAAIMTLLFACSSNTQIIFEGEYVDVVNFERLSIAEGKYVLSDTTGNTVPCFNENFPVCIIQPIPILVGPEGSVEIRGEEYAIFGAFAQKRLNRGTISNIRGSYHVGSDQTFLYTIDEMRRIGSISIYSGDARDGASIVHAFTRTGALD